MKPHYLNPFEPAKERAKLWRSRFYWFVVVLVVLPVSVAFLVDGERALIWAAVFGGTNALFGWIPFVTNCGRCGTPFAFSATVRTYGFTPRINVLKWPPSTCAVCGLDRQG